MSFKLPRYQELTNPQRTILNLQQGKNYLITGAPGTGKSVIALYRASDLCQNKNKKVLMLVFNKPLMFYISSAVKSLKINAEVATWQSWILSFYKKTIRRFCPEENWVYDWVQIKKDFESVGKQYDEIIMDEAQDIPLELIEAVQLIAGAVTCFMDTNQTINLDKCTDQADVEDALGVRKPYVLYENFRNTKPIFDFAKLFNPDVTAEPVRLKGTKPMMIQCSGYGHAAPTQLTSKMIQILKRNFALNYIGVFTNTGAQWKTYQELKEQLPDSNVYLYKSSSRDYSTIDFDNPGIYVLTFNTMKGLEFDAVLIPRCECIDTKNNDQIDRNMFYVAITRASEKVYCFYFNPYSSSKYIDVFKPIKGNEEILNWEK